ncbi:Na(+)/H(+) antiporter subunit G [Austwickia sp. TVS 96-490-7B]|uniref:cation:proton antiporter n=1 Tax=Austwickia sp. TVS 96-490-7B TaxID=2830843 RepID=UPI001C582C7B|nr:monovalent cation/H(+) antiporter subunit G [Austwickia sp. TVS 96-490-7B]MBW3086896.1 Na(+)/H(+) antiporter subunit G [Austwickia sp. TVS 96-490-7B]
MTGGSPQVVLEALIPVLVVLGALIMVISAIAMVRERDAFSRINVLSPATGLGLPLIVLAGYLNRVLVAGFSAIDLIKVIATIGALLVVSSLASNVLARAAYLSGAPVDPRTSPQDLAEQPKA